MSTTLDAGISETDVPYQTEGGELLARIYRPSGPVRAAIVDVHGGAWSGGDRLNNEAMSRHFAKHGILVAAVDFRLAPAARYPASVADTNYAVRWLKSKAQEYGFDARRVGALGSSSGGHQMLLNALRPADPAYTPIKLSSGTDASLRFAVACWPIADPLARYHMAKERALARLVTNHDAYFGDEATMIAGSPQHILERGEQTHLPPLLVLQGTADDNVSDSVAHRFAETYRKAGGNVTLEIFEGQPHAFVTRAVDHPESQRALSLIVDFIHKHAA